MAGESGRKGAKAVGGNWKVERRDRRGTVFFIIII
jgi:hypothetical protein